MMDAASDAAVSCDPACKAIPTWARAKEGASFMPSPTFNGKEKKKTIINGKKLKLLPKTMLLNLKCENLETKISKHSLN